MLAFAFVAFAGCGAGITDALSGTAGMYVQTEDELASSGLAGGPFLPASIDYDISNVGTIPMTWSVSSDQPWVDVTPSNGVLDSLQSESVAVTFAPAAAQLLPGSYTANVSFVNQTDSVGNTSRQVTLTVTAPGSQAMTTATRTTGVAPLSVVFDAVGSQSGVVQPAGPDPDFAAFSYRWSFGDPSSGVWPHTGKSQNAGIGWVAAHVYEQPGTYRATLTVIDANGTQHDYHQDIVVTNPDTVFASRTFHVASNGSDSNTGTQSQPFATIARGLQAAFANGQSGRLRLRKGDTFTSSTSISISNSTASLIDSYGQGSPPTLDFPTGSVGFSAASSNDLRIYGINITCTSTTRASWDRGVLMGHRTLISNCNLVGFGYGASISSRVECCIHATQILNSEEYAFYASGPDDATIRHIALVGNRFDNSQMHLIRTYIGRSVISDNIFQRTTVGVAKMVGRTQANPASHVCVVNNHFATEGNMVDHASIGPQNGQSVEYAHSYLFEGNRFTSRTGGGTALAIRASRITVRNNIFDLEGRLAVHVAPWGISPVPEKVVVEHNTLFDHGQSAARLVDANSSDLTVVRYNILHGTTGTPSAPAGTVQSTGNFVGDPHFTSPVGGDFTLRSTSPAIDQITNSRAKLDFFGNWRPRGAGYEAGAVEH